MTEQNPTPRELSFYFSLAQVGMEMVVPVGLGVWLDHQLGWAPWGVVVGAVLGLVLGLTHLIAMLHRFESRQHKDKSQGPR